MSKYIVVFNKTIVRKELYGSEHTYKKGTVFAQFESKEEFLRWKRAIGTLVPLDCFGHNNYIYGNIKDLDIFEVSKDGTRRKI